jgi:sporulation protein YlmC with PRC-barrel domain
MSSGGESEQFQVGVDVEGTDGRCGTLEGVVIDPVKGALTHLIVKPEHHKGFGRLVPIESVQADGDPIRLSCTVDQFLRLDEGEEMHFLAASDNPWSDAGGRAYSWPYYGAGLAGGMGAGAMSDTEIGQHGTPQPFVEDAIPLGEVEVRRGDPVHATDGYIGSVHGLVIHHGDDHHVTHVLLEEGHLWGRKQVAIPISATERIQDTIRVDLTKEQIERLPPVDLKHPE